MKAMVLAAGLGTRLRPLTDSRPKALVEIQGRSLLEITLTRLKEFGVTDAIVNVHHFAEMIVEYLKVHQNFGMRIEISREEVLLDTGGGLKKAGWFFEGKSGGFLRRDLPAVQKKKRRCLRREVLRVSGHRRIRQMAHSGGPHTLTRKAQRSVGQTPTSMGVCARLQVPKLFWVSVTCAG